MAVEIEPAVVELIGIMCRRCGMTENEAIEIIEEYKGLFPNARNEGESLDMAIKALEKQIPNKPIFSEDKQFALCPCCDMKGLADKQEYCDNCGQKLDWSDE